MDALGRPRGFPVIGFVVPAVLMVLTAVPVVRHHRLEGRLSEVASELAGVRADIICQTLGESWVDSRPEPGYVKITSDGRPERRATITLDTCGDLQEWLESDRSAPTTDQVMAVHILTHESMHMRGLLPEDEAECAAVQRDLNTAVLLGATREQARDLALIYWTDLYPRMPDAYRTSSCQSGEDLDENLPSSPWNLIP
ncbi:MAG: hypothetical protein QG608_71 [Actinomycetota bacterium]|nr:hypothetical protein [Actinomycetota bacterium]